MELAVTNNLYNGSLTGRVVDHCQGSQLNLTNAVLNIPYAIRGIEAGEKGMKEFLFTLGCYEGERVTVISALAQNYVIHVKDARYSIDEDLARAILI